MRDQSERTLAILVLSLVILSRPAWGGEHIHDPRRFLVETNIVLVTGEPFTAMLNCVSSNGIQHASKLLIIKADVFGGKLELIQLITLAARYFVTDDYAVWNPDATEATFTAALFNLTPTAMASAQAKCGEMDARVLFVALLGASDAFVFERRFNSQAFNEAFAAISSSSVTRTATCLGTERSDALSYLVSAAGNFVGPSGTFNAKAFETRLNLVVTKNQMPGTDRQRIEAFLKTMKP